MDFKFFNALILRYQSVGNSLLDIRANSTNLVCTVPEFVVPRNDYLLHGILRSWK